MDNGGCGCGTALGVIAFLVVALVFAGLWRGWREDTRENRERAIEEQQEAETQQQVRDFMAEYAPGLQGRIEQLEQELAEVNRIREELRALEKTFPDQKALIQKEMKRWKELADKLATTRTDIRSEIRAFYVQHRISMLDPGASFAGQAEKLNARAKEMIEEATAVRQDYRQSEAERTGSGDVSVEDLLRAPASP